VKFKNKYQQPNFFTKRKWLPLKRLNISLFLLLLIGLSIFGPVIIISNKLPSFKIEDPLLLLTFIFILGPWSHNRYNKILFGKNIRHLTLPFFILCAWMIFISIVHAIPEAESFYMLSSLFFIFSTLKGVVLAIVIVALARDHKTLKILALGLTFYLALQIIVIYAQGINLFNINTWLTPLYRRELPARFTTFFARTPGTYGNPNVAGIAIIAMCSVPLSTAIFCKGLLSKIVNLSLVAIGTVSVVYFTGSRTALACCLVLFAVPLLLSLFLHGRRGLALFWIVLIVLSTIFAFTHLSKARRANRFLVITQGASLLEDPNLSGRIFNWQNLIDDIGLSVFLGNGVINFQGVVTDNGYISVLFIGGLVGLAIYLWLIVSLAWFYIKCLRQKIATENNYLVFSSLTCLIIFSLGNVTASLYTNARIWATCTIILSFGLCALKKSPYLHLRNRPYT